MLTRADFWAACLPVWCCRLPSTARSGESISLGLPSVCCSPHCPSDWRFGRHFCSPGERPSSSALVGETTTRAPRGTLRGARNVGGRRGRPGPHASHGDCHVQGVSVAIHEEKNRRSL